MYLFTFDVINQKSRGEGLGALRFQLHPSYHISSTEHFSIAYLIIGIHESAQAQVLSPHRLKETNDVLPTENNSNATALPGAGVVDLRMKHHHHQPDFGALSSFTSASATQSLSAQSSHVVEKYLNHMESSVTTSDEPASPENEFAIQQQRASIISGSSQQPAAPPGILTTAGKALHKK